VLAILTLKCTHPNHPNLTRFTFFFFNSPCLYTLKQNLDKKSRRLQSN
jgi:hypothetical protein